MKIMVASDLHGSVKYTELLLAAFGREGADALALLGDLYYHGPRNPLPEGYAPIEVARLLNLHRDRIISVRGNCDSDVDLMISEFPITESAQIFLGRRIYLTHGDGLCFDRLPALPKGSVFFQGHTHVGSLAERDGLCLCNPGSVSLPKENSARGYALVSEDGISRKTLEGEILQTIKF